MSTRDYDFPKRKQKQKKSYSKPKLTKHGTISPVARAQTYY